MKRSILGLWMIILLISLWGCNQNKVETPDSQKEEVSVENADAEVDIKKKNDVTSTSTNGVQNSKGTQENVTSDKQLEMTDTIKNSLVALAPGLSDYNSSKNKNIKDECKFKFIYYGYGMDNHSKYKNVTKNLEGTISKWIMIPESEVKQKFLNTFGVALGDYNPKLDEFSPTIYKAKGFFYVCIDEKPTDSTYTFLNAKKDGKGYVVNVKESLQGEERYNEYVIKISAANNATGFIITNVAVVPR